MQSMSGLRLAIPPQVSGGSVPVRTKSPEPVAEGSVLPPGQRDRSGFWFPLGYEDPRTMVRRRTPNRGATRPHARDEHDGGDEAPSS